MSTNAAKSMTGYLAFVNASLSLEEFKRDNNELCNEFETLLESCGSDKFQFYNYVSKVSILMKAFVENLGKKKFHSKAEQRFIDRELFRLKHAYPGAYSDLQKLLLFFSWDRQYPMGYCWLARLFLGESADSVYSS